MSNKEYIIKTFCCLIEYTLSKETRFEQNIGYRNHVYTVDSYCLLMSISTWRALHCSVGHGSVGQAMAKILVVCATLHLAPPMIGLYVR